MEKKASSSRGAQYGVSQALTSIVGTPPEGVLPSRQQSALINADAHHLPLPQLDCIPSTVVGPSARALLVMGFPVCTIGLPEKTEFLCRICAILRESQADGHDPGCQDCRIKTRYYCYAFSVSYGEAGTVISIGG